MVRRGLENSIKGRTVVFEQHSFKPQKVGPYVAYK
jgi:hypothetical protein